MLYRGPAFDGFILDAAAEEETKKIRQRIEEHFGLVVRDLAIEGSRDGTEIFWGIGERGMVLTVFNLLVRDFWAMQINGATNEELDIEQERLIILMMDQVIRLDQMARGTKRAELEAIQKVDLFTYPVQRESLDKDDCDCTICKESFFPNPENEGLEEPVTTRYCGHIFGKVCLAAWVEANEICPLCRRPLLAQSAEALFIDGHLDEEAEGDEDDDEYTENVSNWVLAMAGHADQILEEQM